jgi:prepilin-type N-terminal cleavage/methylation domain-containing protein
MLTFCPYDLSMKNRQTGFTLIELLVVIGIIVLLAAFLLPMLERGREQAVQVKCASNLQQIGAAIAMYANSNNGAYPRTTYVPDAPIVAGTNPDAPEPFASGGPQPNDLTAAVFLLIRTQQMPSIIFTCPYTDVKTYVADPVLQVSSRSNSLASIKTIFIRTGRAFRAACPPTPPIAC